MSCYGARMTASRLLVAAALGLLLGCETNSIPPAPPVDGGQHADAGADAGLDGGSDGGAPDGGDGGWQLHAFPSRNCDVLGRWAIDAGLQAGFDAGMGSPCLPLPPLGTEFLVTQELGMLYAPLNVSFAEDAGCRLAVSWAFDTSNASENYHHAVQLELDPVDAGLEGGGTYTLSGGSNCQVPLEAVGTLVP